MFTGEFHGPCRDWFGSPDDPLACLDWSPFFDHLRESTCPVPQLISFSDAALEFKFKVCFSRKFNVEFSRHAAHSTTAHLLCHPTIVVEPANRDVYWLGWFRVLGRYRTTRRKSEPSAILSEPENVHVISSRHLEITDCQYAPGIDNLSRVLSSPTRERNEVRSPDGGLRSVRLPVDRCERPRRRFPRCSGSHERPPSVLPEQDLPSRDQGSPSSSERRAS
jgi:hypothetical protein